MSADPRLDPVMHRADLQIDRLHGPERLLHPGEILVHPDSIIGADRRRRHTGADDVEAVEPGLAQDAVGLAAVGKAVLGDGEIEVLRHLVGIDYRPHREPDLGLAPERPMAPTDLACDARQIALGGDEQLLALAGALARELGIAADDEPLARVIGSGDLGEVALVEERELQRPALGERLDLRRPQAGDPVQPGGLEVLAQPRCRDHPAVADQHDVLEPEAALQRRDLRRQGAGIAGVAFEHLDGDRPAVPIAEQAVDDLQPIRSVVAAHMGEFEVKGVWITMPLVRAPAAASDPRPEPIM